VNAHILSGEPREVVAIPSSAVLDEKGIDVVFVMVGGESFERRTVQLGIRDRTMVEVKDGLEPGEVVVSEGPYYVRLASTSTGSIGHGHAH
jgi:multidrug efflux pump subunit AcrA (membrane-fusion protein)